MTRIKFWHFEGGNEDHYPEGVVEDRSTFLAWAKLRIEPTMRYQERLAKVEDPVERSRMEMFERPIDTAETACRRIEQNNNIKPYTYSGLDFIETAHWLGYFYGE